MAQDINPNYWAEYTNLQHVKHALIREYLKGWFPKLGFWSGRIVYLDTHAGRGKHIAGQTGSPVMAIDTLLSHTYRDRILEKSEVTFCLIEHDPENVDALRAEVAALGKLPRRIQVHISCDDCFSQLEKLLSNLEEKGKKIAPAFVFVDPYGFKVPGDLIRRLVAAGRVEVFINIIWRELDMAIAQAQNQSTDGMVETLNLVFGGDRWRNIGNETSLDIRADRAIDLFRELYGARWVTSIRMLGDNKVTRYVLAHFSNHEAGRDLMKDCMWNVCPDGGFYARRSDNPNQTMLIEVEPNLSPLDDWVTCQLRGGAIRWSALSQRVRNELWRQAHLSQVIRKRRREGTIVASKFTRSFFQERRPTFVSTGGKVGGIIMAGTSRIEWTESTWNPVTGCTKISPGCKNCYAHRMARRLHAMGQARYRNNFAVTLQPDVVHQPLRWNHTRKIFVNSMSDLFHDDVPLEFILDVFDVMGKADWHTFQILTKRSERLVEFAGKLPWHENVWMGVSVENQDYTYRIEHLRKVPASVRFLSVEPLLGPIPRLPLQGIHWVIVGGESGPGARTIDPRWVRKIRDRCIAQGVPFFFKQWGGTRKKSTGRELDGRTWDEMPESLSKRSKRILA